MKKPQTHKEHLFPLLSFKLIPLSLFSLLFKPFATTGKQGSQQSRRTSAGGGSQGKAASVVTVLGLGGECRGWEENGGVGVTHGLPAWPRLSHARSCSPTSWTDFYGGFLLTFGHRHVMVGWFVFKEAPDHLVPLVGGAQNGLEAELFAMHRPPVAVSFFFFLRCPNGAFLHPWFSSVRQGEAFVLHPLPRAVMGTALLGKRLCVGTWSHWARPHHHHSCPLRVGPVTFPPSPPKKRAGGCGPSGRQRWQLLRN